MLFKWFVGFLVMLQCGTYGKTFQPRIIVELAASATDFPYSVSVQKMVYVFVHVCGGALIKENYVLTAAHCLANSSMQVRGGLPRIVNSIAPKAAVIERYVHPNYSKLNDRTINDIAVLKLATSFQLSSTIQVISLPAPNFVASGRAVFSGWGTVNSSVETFSNQKMFTVLDIINLAECKQALINSTGSAQRVSDNNICTFSTSSFTCYRDDGGPLAQYGVVVGISSWQIMPCDSTNAPSIFTKVSNYVNWINQQLL